MENKEPELSIEERLRSVETKAKTRLVFSLLFWGITIICLIVLISIKWCEVGIGFSDESNILTFVGVLATFVVVSNYIELKMIDSRVNDALRRADALEKKAEAKIKDVEDRLTLENVKAVLKITRQMNMDFAQLTCHQFEVTNNILDTLIWSFNALRCAMDLEDDDKEEIIESYYLKAYRLIQNNRTELELHIMDLEDLETPFRAMKMLSNYSGFDGLEYKVIMEFLEKKKKETEELMEKDN